MLELRLICADCGGKLSGGQQHQSSELALCPKCRREREQQTKSETLKAQLNLRRRIARLVNGSHIRPRADLTKLEEAARRDRMVSNIAKCQATRLKELKKLDQSSRRRAQWIAPYENPQLTFQIRTLEHDLQQARRQSGRHGPTKSPSWGPRTAEAVKVIVDNAEEVFRELSANEAAIDFPAERRACYYGGLLCLEAGVLPSTSADVPREKELADIIRSRLNRRTSLLTRT